MAVWDGLYTDLPSRQTKLTVADRTVRCARQCVEAGMAVAGVASVTAAMRLPRSGALLTCALCAASAPRCSRAAHGAQAIRCSEDERRVLQPAELQVALDGLMLGVESGRCFVRPSGTEDAVRIYAEAATQPLADGLALDAARAVHALAGGVGPAPERFAA